MENVTYYLFGHEAVSCLETDGIEALLAGIENQTITAFQIYQHNESDPSIMLATEMIGWDDYATLSKIDYYSICAIEC